MKVASDLCTLKKQLYKWKISCTEMRGHMPWFLSKLMEGNCRYHNFFLLLVPLSKWFWRKSPVFSRLFRMLKNQDTNRSKACNRSIHFRGPTTSLDDDHSDGPLLRWSIPNQRSQQLDDSYTCGTIPETKHFKDKSTNSAWKKMLCCFWWWRSLSYVHKKIDIYI